MNAPTATSGRPAIPAPDWSRLHAATAGAALHGRFGHVRRVSGGTIEAVGPDVALGEVCTLRPRAGAPAVEAEVVALHGEHVTLMPYGPALGIAAGCRVVADGTRGEMPVGDALLGRVIDAFGQPLDGLPAPRPSGRRALRPAPLNPLQRPRIERVLETGVRCIDGLLTLGEGQRVGIFAASGVGKSTLLGLVARHVRADVNVIALVGERGREVRAFIERQLGAEGLRRSVVVVAASDQPALARVRAAHAALAVAEHFRDQGRQVMLTMDSVTRYAMARREVGLAAGEPPTARGYTPSVFAELPVLCERCGTAPSGGAITALFTVLVEGDDHDEPVADVLRATLDGHIVLSREIATRGLWPAIDVLRSTSRLMPELAEAPDRAAAGRLVQALGLLQRNRAMVEIGAYVPGSNPALDRALAAAAQIDAFLRQDEGGVRRADTLAALHALGGLLA